MLCTTSTRNNVDKTCFITCTSKIRSEVSHVEDEVQMMIDDQTGGFLNTTSVRHELRLMFKK
jgi:hypothetical protein